MNSNNLKRLRNEKELTQESIANILGCKRTTYNNWERGVVMIPIDIVDKLSVYYKVSISCILGIENKIEYKKNVNKMNYDNMLSKLTDLKVKEHLTYNKLGEIINCSGTTCQRYYNGIIKIPIDRLIMLSNLYNISIDELCGKENNRILVKN